MLSIFRSNQGLSMPATILASAIAATGLFYFIQSTRSMTLQAKSLHEKVVAESYASELLEYLRSHEEIRLDTNLATNPFASSPYCTANPTECAPYPYCAHINILDRTTGTIVNEHPIAALPDSPTENPLFRGEAKFKANRWFQVQIVDLADVVLTSDPSCNSTTKDCGKITLRTEHCDKNAAQTRFPKQAAGGATVLNPSETYLITVGVSWLPRKVAQPTMDDVKRVVLSTIIPTKGS